MSLLFGRIGAFGLATALQIAFTVTPAVAEVIVPARILPTPIIPPPFVVVSDTDTTEEGLALDRLTVVVGMGVASDYEGSDDYVFGPVVGATARVHGHSISWAGNSLGVDLIPAYRRQKFKLSVAPFININLDGTGTPHDPVVALIGKRKKALEGGVVIGANWTGIVTSDRDSLSVQVSGAQDLGSVHKSFIVTPSVSYTAPLSKVVLVSASASFDVVGAGYARYYFGVDSNASASSGLPFYEPSGGLKSTSLALGSLVSLGGDLRSGFAVGVKLRYQRMLDDSANSPLVAQRGNPNQFSVGMGLAYTF